MIGDYAFALEHLLSLQSHARRQFVDSPLSGLGKRVSAELLVPVARGLQNTKSIGKMLLDPVKLEHQAVRILVLLAFAGATIGFCQMHFQLI